MKLSLTACVQKRVSAVIINFKVNYREIGKLNWPSVLDNIMDIQNPTKRGNTRGVF